MRMFGVRKEREGAVGSPGLVRLEVAGRFPIRCRSRHLFSIWGHGRGHSVALPSCCTATRHPGRLTWTGIAAWTSGGGDRFRLCIQAHRIPYRRGVGRLGCYIASGTGSHCACLVNPGRVLAQCALVRPWPEFSRSSGRNAVFGGGCEGQVRSGFHSQP